MDKYPILFSSALCGCWGSLLFFGYGFLPSNTRQLQSPIECKTVSLVNYKPPVSETVIAVFPLKTLLLLPHIARLFLAGNLPNMAATAKGFGRSISSIAATSIEAKDMTVHLTNRIAGRCIK